MMELVSQLRAMQLYAHNSHNLVSKSLFFQDHDFLGDLYPKYEEAYDSVVERAIGLAGDIDLLAPQVMAVEKLKNYQHSPSDNRACFEVLLQMEKELCSIIENYIKTMHMSEGSRQLLGDIANESEMRQYKLAQRSKK